MNVWKEKVAEKLSSLLADSPSPPPSTATSSSGTQLDSNSPAATPASKVFPFSKEELSPSETRSYSSYALYFLQKASHSFGKDGSDSSTGCNGLSPPSLPSFPAIWKDKNFSWRDILTYTTMDSEDSGESDIVETSKENLELVPKRNGEVSVRPEAAPSSYSSEKFLSNLMDDSTFISSSLFVSLQSYLPNIVKGCQWVLLYSTLKHGISLRTLLHRSTDTSGPCLLIAGDKKGAIFGGLLDSAPRPTAKWKYQGTNQTFVFTTLHGEPMVFRATGANRYYYMCLNDLLAFGGGGNFALCLDDDLLHGRSGHCETFGNSCLAHSSEFELSNVELWGFAHISRYQN